MPPRPFACSSATRAMPLRSLRLTRAGSVIALPFVPTVTSRRSRSRASVASSAESSSSACGRWNWSSVTRSTAAPEKSGLYATRRTSPWPVAFSLGAGAGARRRAPARRGSRAAARARRPRRTRGRRRPSPTPRAKTAAAYGATSTPKRAASSRDPLELVGARRGHGAAQPLEAALEVDERPVALEVARAGQEEVGAQPAASPSNIEMTIVASACSASARTFGFAAASSPETTSTPIDSGSAPSSSQHAAHASATPRPFGVSGGRRRRSPRGRRGRASPRARRPSRRRGRRGRTRSARRARRPRRRRRRVEDLRAVAPRGLDPEVDDRRALDDRHVAEDDDRRRRRGSRRAAAGSASSAPETSSGSIAWCESSPTRSSLPSAYACSTVSEPESAVTTRPRAPRSSRSASSIASLPRDPRADAAPRLASAGPRRAGA